MYNLPECTRLRGELNIPALRSAVEAIVARHEAWRTTFGMADGIPVQVVHPTLAPHFSFDDFSREPGNAERAVRKLLVEYSDIPFDLIRGPLLRIHLVRCADQDHYLLLNVHHIVSDNWSTGVFLREFAELYNSRLTRSVPDLPELPVQYSDYAEWQRRYYAVRRLEELLSRWQEMIRAGAELMTDYARPPVPVEAGEFQSLELSKSLTDALHAIARAHGVTLFVVLVSAFMAAISHVTGSARVSLGIPVAGRGHKEVEPLLGLFANTVVLQASVDQHAPFTSLMTQVARTAINSFTDQDAPFDQIVERLKPDRDVSVNPLFQVMFVFQNRGLPRINLQDLSMDLVATGTRSVKFDLVFELYETPQGLRGWMGFQTALFSHQTIERLLRCYRRFLERLPGSPHISSAELLTDASVGSALAAFNDPL